MLTKSQERFLAQRKFFSKIGFWIGIGTFLVLIIIVIYMYFRHPWLANPYYVMAQLENNALSLSILSILATVGSFLFLIISLILGVFIVFFILAVRNERKLINIIDTLQKHDARDT